MVFKIAKGKTKGLILAEAHFPSQSESQRTWIPPLFSSLQQQGKGFATFIRHYSYNLAGKAPPLDHRPSLKFMYLDHFGLDEAPFKITPHTEFFYQGASRGAILEGLLYAILNGEGLIKIVGEVGAGKTMLSRVTIERLPDNVQSILITTPSIDPDEMLLTIAEELGLNTSGQRHTNIVRTLQECLIEKYAKGMQVVVFIDEAHAMPRETLEEIRLLSNLESSRNKLLQIVILGQPELDDLLARPEMRQLRERVTHSFNLQPLNEDDIRQYLAFRMRAAGYKGPDVFALASIKWLARASQGLTRRVNILADKALLAAFADNTHGITPAHVKAAIKDSEFGQHTSNKKHLPWLVGGLLAGLALAGIVYLLTSLSATHAKSMEATAATVDYKPENTLPPTAAIPGTTIKTTTSLGSKQENRTRQQLTTSARIEATRNLLQSERNAYTIQLFLADPPPSTILDRLLTQPFMQTGEAIQVYQTATNGKKHLAVTYGLYKTKEDAKQAMMELPEELTRNGPILRTLKGIREEIKETSK